MIALGARPRRLPLLATAWRWWLGLPPLAAALLVTAAYTAYVVWRLRLTGGDPSFFVVAGPLATDPSGTLPNLHVFPSGTTYDGQFFYRLALEPWTHARTAYGITLDGPAYRQQRILYPLIAWLLSLGQWQLTPLALIVANLVGVAVLAYAAALFAASAGRHVLTSVLVPFYPGYVVSVSRDLAEVTEAAFLLVGLVLMRRGRYALAALALTAGALSKETLLVVPMVGVLRWAIQRRRGGRDAGAALAAWLTPIVVYAAWSGVMALRWGNTGVGQGYINFGLPFEALLQHLGTLGLGTPAWRSHLLELGLLGLIGTALLLVGLSYRRQLLAGNLYVVACVTYAALALAYAIYIWRDDYAYLRALHELFLTGALALLVRSAWASRLLAGLTTLVCLVFATQIGGGP